LLSAGRPLSRSACFEAAAPTNPTGRPMTSAATTSRRKISSSAVGAHPTTHTAPGPASPKASRAAAAETVMPTVRASRAARDSPILQITG
jgi:hypothetical protein